MKKIISLLLVFSIIFALSACNKTNNGDANENAGEIKGKIKIEKYLKKHNYTSSDVEVETDFSEDIAFVNIRSKLATVDTSGNIIFISDDLCEINSIDYWTYNYVSGYKNGYCLCIGSGESVIINKKGEIVISPEKQGFDKMITNNSNFDGKAVMVLKHIDEYDYSEDQIGVLDMEGKWLYPLSSDHPFIKDEGNKKVYINDYSPESFGNGWLYYANVAYNLYTNENLKGNDLISIVGLSDNYGVICKTAYNDHEYYKIDKSGNVIGQLLGSEYNYSLFLSGNWLFVKGYTTKDVFYNLETDKSIVLDEYIIYSDYEFGTLPKFNEGYALLKVENPSGEKYVMVIDENGNKIFTPMKYKEAVSDIVSEGYFCCDGNFYDINGNLKIEKEGKKYISDFHCGYAQVGNNFIDKNGNYLYEPVEFSDYL